MSATHSTPALAIRSDAVAGRIRRLLNEGMLALLAGVGDRAGLLGALGALGPSRLDRIARAAGWPVRRAERWLGAMVAGRIVEYDGARSTYTLPAEYGAFLAAPQGRAFRARLQQMLALASTLAAFDIAGLGDEGTGPADTDDRAVAAFKPEADVLHDTLPWKEIVGLVPGVEARLADGADVLEIDCRRGALTCALAEAHPASCCLGRDRAPREIAAARAAAERRSLANAVFRRGRGVPTRAPRSFDLVLALDERALDREGSARRLHRILRPGGWAVLAVPPTSGHATDDALHPLGPFLLGARALAPDDDDRPTDDGSAGVSDRADRDAGDVMTLAARLAAAGLEVAAQSALAADPFRNFLLVRKASSPTWTPSESSMSST